MDQLRQDLRTHPWAAALVCVLLVAPWGFAFAVRGQARVEWLGLGPLLSAPVAAGAAALVWLRRDIRAYLRATALVLAGLAESWAYSAVMRVAGADAALGAGLALNMPVDGTAAALVCRARGAGGVGIRGGLLAAGHYPRRDQSGGLYVVLAGLLGLFASLAGITVVLGRWRGCRPGHRPSIAEERGGGVPGMCS